MMPEKKARMKFDRVRCDSGLPVVVIEEGDAGDDRVAA